MDGNNYESNQTVTVLGNTGTLVKTWFTYGGWTNSAGTLYAAGNTFAMGSANVTLYAKWLPDTRIFGGTSYDSGYAVATDSNGNIFVTGYFLGTADFDPGASADNKTSAGSGDVFLTKINSNGFYAWTKTFGGGAFDSGKSVTTDSSGNIFVTGYFDGTADFDPGAGTDNKTSAGTNDIFLTKINSDGSYGWTKTFGGTDNEVDKSVATDSSGNIFVTGSFSGTADFDPGAGTDNKTSVGANDIFLSKINSDGTYGWTKTFGGTSFDEGSSVVTDSSGNIFVTGCFEGTIDFDPGAGTDNKTSAGGSDIFLTKINSDGTYGWTKTFGGTSQDVGYSVTKDSSGNIFVTGKFSGTVDFDPSAGTENKTSAGNDDIFLLIQTE